MRWCSFVASATGGPDGTPRLGAVVPRPGQEQAAAEPEAWVLDVGAWARAREGEAPADLVDLVEASPSTQGRVAALVATVGADSPGWVPMSHARLLAPLRAPNSLRDFLGFRDHVERGAARRGTPVPDAWDEMPVYYKGNRRSIVGPDEAVCWPSYTERLDYECEVAAVVGRGGRDIAEGDADGHVFGYTIMNDWSARDVQAREMSCWLGPAKGKDFATSLGPVLVSADSWSPEDEHAMTVTVDGEVWSRGSTAGRRWTFAQMLAGASRDEDLYASDVVGSGTFGGGCGLDLGRDLHPGAVVTLEVEGLGTLTNTVVR